MVNFGSLPGHRAFPHCTTCLRPLLPASSHGAFFHLPPIPCTCSWVFKHAAPEQLAPAAGSILDGLLQLLDDGEGNIGMDVD